MRVLVIEHHPLMARALKQGLEEEGFAVTLALTREEGDCHSFLVHPVHAPEQIVGARVERGIPPVGMGLDHVRVAGHRTGPRDRRRPGDF